MDKSLGFTPVVPSQNKNIPAVDTKDWHMNVYIWDMDETLILLKSLLDGTYAEAFSGSKDVKKGTEIGKRWENLILQVCDEYFFYEKIENYNEPYLDALSKYDDGRDLSDYDFSNDSFSLPHDDSIKRKVAYRHRIIAQKYAQGLHNILDQEMIKVWKDLYALTDRYTDGWLSSARGFLELISGRNKDSASYLISSKSTAESTDMKSLNLNILVTSGSLIPSLVKCLLFQFDDLLSHENVYSSWEVGKHQCFMRIKERFGGPSVRFCVIGDGMEECQAAQMMGWPYIRIDLQPSGTHRFPGLTMSMLEHCIEDAYGTSTVENNEEYES